MSRDSKDNGFGNKVSGAYHHFETILNQPFEFLGNLFIAWPIHAIQKHVFGIDRAVTGNEAMLYETVVVEKVDDSGYFPEYMVMYEGERWKLDCDEDLAVGDEVQITYDDGLTLIGRKIE